MATTATDLWRAGHKSEFPGGLETEDGPVEGALYPDFADRELSSGKTRKADVVIIKGNVQPLGGTSLFDRDRFFKSKAWHYFMIPEGTEIDPRLVVRYTGYNDFFKADHYQIEPVKPIDVASYKGALDNFARAAYAKAYENAR